MDCEKWRLGSGQVYACVQTFKGVHKVHIRNFFQGDSGKLLATVKGVALGSEEWESLKSLIQTIDLEFKRRLTQQFETSYAPLYSENANVPPVTNFDDLCRSLEKNN